MVVSGGKGFIPLDEGLEKEQTHPDSDSLGGSSMIVWEAYEAKTIRQVKIVEKSSPNHLKNHSSIIEIIQQGKFKDGTFVMSDSILTKDLQSMLPVMLLVHQIEFLTSPLPHQDKTLKLRHC